jgi:hypothetical protein
MSEKEIGGCGNGVLRREAVNIEVDGSSSELVLAVLDREFGG